MMKQNTYLVHHGIKNMKWGVRNYQNADGSLTPEGRVRYGVGKIRDSVSGAIKKARTSGLADSVYSARAKARRTVDAVGERALSAAGRVGVRAGNAYDKAMFFVDGRQAQSIRSRLYADATAFVERQLEAKKKASYENLLRQREYSKRVSAAKSYLSVLDTMKRTVRQASDYRFYNRGHVWGEAATRDPYNPSGPILTNYRAAKKAYNESPRETVNDLYWLFKENIDGHQGGVALLRSAADRHLRRARGH